MKTKQSHIKAKFTTYNENAKNYSGEKELISKYVIVDKITEKQIVDCRVYMGRSSKASTVYASLWVSNIKESKIPAKYSNTYYVQSSWDESVKWRSTCVSGTGRAGGGGYCKESAAIGDAISSTGIELFGTPYNASGGDVDFKKRAYINGTGCHKDALLAIAYAAGYNNCILVEC